MAETDYINKSKQNVLRKCVLAHTTYNTFEFMKLSTFLPHVPSPYALIICRCTSTLSCKSKQLWLLTFQVKTYCCLPLHDSGVYSQTSASDVFPLTIKLSGSRTQATNNGRFNDGPLWQTLGQNWHVVVVGYIAKCSDLGGASYSHRHPHCRAQPKGSSFLLFRWAVTAFWLCRAVHSADPVILCPG